MKNLTITLEELKERIQNNNIISFSYIKKDGTKCIAKGTLSSELIPVDFAQRDTSVDYAINFRYYDLDKAGWRSISPDCSTILLLS